MANAQFPNECDERGAWKRQESAFRNRVTADGSSPFPAAANRYHLYVSYACPWAHRTIIFRVLKRLEDVVTLSAVDPIRDERGWRFTEGRNHGPDPVNGFSFLSEAYRATDPGFQGRVTVPVLWDRERGVIVNNESSEIIRMLNGPFASLEGVPDTRDYCPEPLREEIDAVNARVYETINDGVYKCGFAATQEAYDEGFTLLFDGLDWVEARLGEQRYLVGDELTEADWRLFTTLVRFDPVYYVHFKCNRNHIYEFPNLWGYLRDLYQQPGIAGTVDMDHIKRHYFVTHDRLNPSGIVPRGPVIDFAAPHDRVTVGAL